jgi:murein DD-endopeptidase MepM/ murein hydrolase activator NlpD
MDSLSTTDLLTTQLANSISNSAENSTATSTQTESSTFSQLLSLMLLSSISSSSSSSGSGSSSGITAMLAPLMMLLEQLQSQQLQSQGSNSSLTAESTATKSASANSKLTSDASDPNVCYPVDGVLTQGYTSTHNGLDFGVVTGTDVQSTISGKVIYAGWNNEGYGNLVIVQNGDVKTYYAHLSEVPVSVGQSVNKGDVIGLSGSTGNSTGPHVHYEVRINNANIDPSTFDSSSY